ncbi:hypothetical protein EYF80_009258 [Liparis tanakae]|uniref:Uncharacterized protein n=1 Tax=Liparis tanakae TaxID=230148 RepID=A0A4Z2IRA5_9TELE|nr:hypothetical protein EYF80_009258 [Liparis tanakae]
MQYICTFKYLSKKDGEQAFIDIVIAEEFWQSSPSNIIPDSRLLDFFDDSSLRFFRTSSVDLVLSLSLGREMIQLILIRRYVFSDGVGHKCNNPVVAVLVIITFITVHRRRGLHDKHAPGLLTDSSAVICMSKATCCRSERGYPARIPGIPIPNAKPAFRVLVGSFLTRFRSGPGFSVTAVRGEKQCSFHWAT